MTPSQIQRKAFQVAETVDEAIRRRLSLMGRGGWTRQDGEILACLVGEWVAQEVRREMTELVCSACGSSKCEEAVTLITRAEYLVEQSELPEEKEAPAYNVFEDYDPMKGEI